MANNKHPNLKKRLIVWALVLALLAALVIFVGIPLYGPQTVRALPETQVQFHEPSGETLTMESDELLFEMDADTTYFTVTDKRSGQTWTSIPENAKDDPLANAANKEILQSTMIVGYTTNTGQIELNSFIYAIQNGTYWLEQAEDGSICVHYAIGRIEKIYRIPNAITEQRYNDFRAKMSKSTAKKVESNYTKLDPAKLDAREDKAEMLALYPECANQVLYILKSNTSENNKAKIQGYFEEAGYTQEDYEYDQTFVAGSTTKAGAVFNIDLHYSLEGNDLVVEIPFKDIRYKEEYTITSLSVLPMFGAAGLQDDGFMLVPEGGGALIYNNNHKTSQNNYYANFYGWDYASKRSEARSETRADFAAFGMAQNGGSFVCMIQDGAAFGGVQADISQRRNSYNTVYARYNVLHYDKYNVSAKTENLVYMYEQDLPQTSVIQRYRFLESDSYVDMARAYGDYLTEQGILPAQGHLASDLPVSVELVGAIDKTVEKLGVPVDSVVATTTFRQAEAIMDDLKQSGAQNLSVRVTGWSNGGLTQSVLTKIKPESVLGGKKGLSSLINKAKDEGIDLYLDGISAFAYDSGVLKGFVPFTNAARYTTREQVRLYKFDPVTFQEAEWQDAYYLAKPAYADKMAHNLISYLDETGAGGVAFRDIGLLLSGDYNPKDSVDREQVKRMHVRTLDDARSAGLKVLVKQGSDYTLGHVDLISDMDVKGIPYSLIDLNVPFYQIAIHGRVGYTGLAINISNDYIGELLTCAEYGSGLHFCFMAEDTQILQDTLHSGYYAAWYEPWKQDVIKMISRYQSEMAGLGSVSITNHKRLSDKVFLTQYADGTCVYVNYSMQAFDADGVTVPARDYLVLRGN